MQTIHGLRTPDFGMERGMRMGLGLPISEIDQMSGQIHRNQKTVVGILFLIAAGRTDMLCADHIVLQG